MIECFTIDGMHTIFLGALRRFLHFLKNPKQSRVARVISDKGFLEIGQIWNTFKMPREFSRSTRNYEHIDKWKATEFRAHMLYGLEIIVRVSELPTNMVYIIQMFCMAIRILADPELYVIKNGLAKQLINCFLDSTAESYFGRHFITLIIHCLTHMPDECLRNGPLDTISCFKFENVLKSLKERCRSYRFPLQSLANQLRYKANFVSKRTKLPLKVHGKPEFPLRKQFCTRRPVDIDGEQFKFVRFKNFMLANSAPNCYFRTAGKNIYQVECIIQKPCGQVVLVCRQWSIESAYFVPSSSDELRIESDIVGVMRLVNLRKAEDVINIEDVDRKCVVHSYAGMTYSWPLLPL